MMTIDRIREPLIALIHDEFPGLGYLGLWEYVISSVNADGSVNGQTTATVEVPPLNNVPIGALVAGGVSNPTVGTTFLVEFRNIDGARYAFVSVDALVKTATIDANTSVNIGPTAKNPIVLANGTKQKARSGDQLTCFWPLDMTITVGTLTLTAGGTLPLAGYGVQLLGTIPALIVYGNEDVLS